MKKKTADPIDKLMEFFNVALARSLGKLFQEPLLNLFLVVDESAPNEFNVSIGVFFQVDEAEKQLLLFEGAEGATSEDIFQKSIFDSAVTLAGAALNMLQLEAQDTKMVPPEGLRLSYSVQERFSHWEPVYMDEKRLSAAQWIRKLIDESENSLLKD